MKGWGHWGGGGGGGTSSVVMTTEGGGDSGDVIVMNGDVPGMTCDVTDEGRMSDEDAGKIITTVIDDLTYLVNSFPMTFISMNDLAFYMGYA